MNDDRASLRTIFNDALEIEDPAQRAEHSPGLRHRPRAAPEDRGVDRHRARRRRDNLALANAQVPLWFSFDGSRLIALHRDDRLHVWDTRRREDLGRIGPPMNHITARTISSDGKWLALGMSAGAIELWNLDTGERERTREDDDYPIAHVAFSRSGGLLAAAGPRAVGASEQRTVRIWNRTTGKELFTVEYLKPAYAFLFSPNGEFHLALTTEDVASREPHVELWHAPKFEQIASVEAGRRKKIEAR